MSTSKVTSNEDKGCQAERAHHNDSKTGQS